MLQSNATLDIIVNGQMVDILDRSSINLRINSVIYNPTEIKSKQAEYSFSFNLPTTPNNNRIFDYANELSKLNKFKNVYNCEVYVDGDLIFNGSLRISSIKKGFYNVNLVSIKINTLEDIFGDMTMNEIDWKIPFESVGSINTYNADLNSEVFFPLVSYGVFQKSPSYSNSSDIENYTSKFVFDKSNRWYYETFNPSMSLLGIVRRAFEQKGYKVEGNIFEDDIVNKLYTSINIANDQKPTYNIGNPNFGALSISCQFSSYVNKNTGAAGVADCLEHNLSFPYVKCSDNDYVWDKVDIYDLWTSQNSKITVPNNQYLFDENSNCIVVPADGLYKIRISVNGTLPFQTVKVDERIKNLGVGDITRQRNLNNDFNNDMPIEIQLVRNTNTCELIHGIQQEEWYTVGPIADITRSSWYTAYPHENLYGSTQPTTSNALYGGYHTTGDGYFIPNSGLPNGVVVDQYEFFQGFMPKEGDLLAFDPWVNPYFIAGVSTYGPGVDGAVPSGKGTPSVIKNGYSWNSSTSDKNGSRYNCEYWQLSYKPGGYEWKANTINKNRLLDSPDNTVTVNGQQFTGTVNAIVKLNKNDIVSLKALARHWSKDDNSVRFKFDCNVTVEMQAYSPNSIESMDYNGRGWNSPTEFDSDLQLGNFLNKGVQVKNFIDNFIKEFNLSYINEGNVVYLNKQQLDIDKPKYAINIDDRVNINDFETEMIDYPSSLEVKYKIDTEEWGFETTVPADKLNDSNWKDYGDYGSSKIEIDDRKDNTGEELNLTTSYCWYDEFRMLDDNGTEIAKFNIPVISKYSYMIDGCSYQESMKVDGKGLPMRYWFRNQPTKTSVLVNKVPIYITTTTNKLNGIELSYKNKDGSLLRRFFNLHPNLSSNYVKIKCYLTAKEYQQLKIGANVIYNSDTYIVSEIGGFDAMGINTCELTLIKKENYGY